MMKHVILWIFFLTCIFRLAAQTIKINYSESNEDIRNPERGFYIPFGTKASDFTPLDSSKLSGFRTVPQQPAKRTYAFNVSLIYRAYELDVFKDKALSDSFLHNIQRDFDAVRAAGLKMILRFAYVNTTHAGDCKDDYKICPPYGDAPKQIVSMHIRQLKQLLRKNADVIAVLQQGFIGIWGENYFTDYFGCATNDGAGVIQDSSWKDRNVFLKELLDALPEDRMVQVRTPQIKQRYVYGAHSSIDSKPIAFKDAFSKKDIARIGFHNDCFLASPDDYGTFYDYGNSTSKRDTANERLREYFKADSRFVAVGGETCDDAFSPQNDCAPAGHAEEEMRQMHYSYLNSHYNNDVISDWDSLGCLHNIKRKLGYRFVLRTATLPRQAQAGTALNFLFTMENIGYASPYNPRPVKVVFVSVDDNAKYELDMRANPQAWLPGMHRITETISLPKTMKKGEYKLYLFLPDANALLQKRPEYCIQLANQNTWDSKHGLNSLNHTIKIF